MTTIEFKDYSAESKEEIKTRTLKALEMCGLAVETFAKRLVKVNTGNLRNSITHRVDEEEPAVYIGSDVEYAAYVELGTGKYFPGGRPTPWAYQDAKGKWHWTAGNKAQPYLKPAAADHKGELIQCFQKAFED